MINREEFENIPSIAERLKIGDVYWSESTQTYKPKGGTYRRSTFINGAWNMYQEMHKQNAALKVLLGMNEAHKQALITVHEAEKAMIIHAKKIKDGECVVASGIVDDGYCTNIKTGETRDSIKYFLKNNKPKDKDSVMNKAVDMARDHGTAFVQLKINTANEIEYKNIDYENVILRKTED